MPRLADEQIVSQRTGTLRHFWHTADVVALNQFRERPNERHQRRYPACPFGTGLLRFNMLVRWKVREPVEVMTQEAIPPPCCFRAQDAPANKLTR